MRYLLYCLLLYPALLPAQSRASWRLPFAQQGSWGLMDGTGQLLLQATYRHVRQEGATTLVQHKGGRWQALDSLLVPIDTQLWDSVRTLALPSHGTPEPVANWRTVHRSGRMGLLDTRQCRLILPTLYDSIGLCTDSLYYVWQNGKMGLLSHRGTLLLPAVYDTLWASTLHMVLMQDDRAQLGLLYLPTGYVLPCAYDSLWASAWAVVLYRGGQAGWCIPAAGNTYPTEWDEVVPQAEPGALAVRKGNCWQLWLHHRTLATGCYTALSLQGGHLVAQTEQGIGVYDTTLRCIAPHSWQQAIPLSYGIAVMQNNRWGYWRQDSLMLPCQYDTVEEMDQNLLLCRLGDRVGWYARGKGIATAPTYQHIELHQGYMLVQAHGLYAQGLHRPDGTVVLPARYRSIVPTPYGLIKVQTRSGYTLTDTLGRQLMEAYYDSIHVADSQLATGYLHGKTYRLDLARNETHTVTTLRLRQVASLLQNATDSLRTPTHWWIKDADTQLWGMADAQAQHWVVAPLYSRIRPTAQQYIVVQMAQGGNIDGGLMGVYDYQTGAMILPCKYIQLKPEDWQQHTYARAHHVQTGMQLVSRTGRVRYYPSAVGMSNWQEGVLTLVLPLLARPGHAHTQGIGPHIYTLMGETSNTSSGLVRRVNTAQYLYRLLNRHGIPLTTDLLEGAQPCHRGAIPAKKGGYWGLMDTTGQWLTKPIYRYIEPGNNGLFVAKDKNGRARVLNYRGQLLPLKPYTHIRIISDERMWVAINRSTRKNYDYRIGLADTTGQERIATAYTQSTDGNPTHLLTATTPSYRLTDSLGRPLSSTLYARVGTYSCNRIRVQAANGLYGYCDSQGREVVPPQYTQAVDYSCGVSWAKMKGKSHWTLIDSLGKPISNERYTRAGTFEDGYAEITRRGHSYRINTQGKRVWVRTASYHTPDYPPGPVATALYEHRLLDNMGNELAKPLLANKIYYLAQYQLYVVEYPDALQYLDDKWQPLKLVPATTEN